VKIRENERGKGTKSKMKRKRKDERKKFVSNEDKGIQYSKKRNETEHPPHF
jgi:hypothetical protein